VRACVPALQPAAMRAQTRLCLCLCLCLRLFCSLRPRVQKLLRANIEHAEKQEALAAEWAFLKRAHEEAYRQELAKGGQPNRPPPVPMDLLRIQVCTACLSLWPLCGRRG